MWYGVGEDFNVADAHNTSRPDLQNQLRDVWPAINDFGAIAKPQVNRRNS